MMKYKFYQDNRSNAQHKGNWYAHMNLDGTMGLDELAAHMSDHGTPYSKGVICGVLNDMVGCIKELVLEGNAVKLDNLAIFSVGIESKPANTKEEFNARTHITGYKLRARATGGSINARLSHLASINQMGEYSHDEAEKAETKAVEEEKAEQAAPAEEAAEEAAEKPAEEPAAEATEE